jgi:hypothetical protein
MGARQLPVSSTLLRFFAMAREDYILTNKYRRRRERLVRTASRQGNVIQGGRLAMRDLRGWMLAGPRRLARDGCET